MNFQAEHAPNPFTLVATEVLTAGDPVTAAGAVGSGPTDTVGIAMSDAAIGEAVPIAGIGAVLNVLADSGSSGVTAGDPVTYASDGFDVTTGFGVGFALDDADAEGYFRMVVHPAVPAAGTALTAAAADTVDGTYGAEEATVIGNLRTRVGEIEDILQAAGLLA